MTDIRLTGLDPMDPLGFMAALGCLLAVDSVGTGTLLAFHDDGAGYVPVLRSEHDDVASLVAAVMTDLSIWKDSDVLDFSYEKKNKTIRDIRSGPDEFEAVLSRLVRGGLPNRWQVDMTSAWGSPIVTDKKGGVVPTALHLVSGAQRFLEIARRIVRGHGNQHGVDAADLTEALVGPRTQGRRLPTFRWGGNTERLYALRGTDPSNGKDSYTAPGEEWLAFRAIPMFQVCPGRDPRWARTSLRTSAFDGDRLVWPIWSDFASPRAVASLIRAGDWRRWDVERREERGIVAVYAATRYRSGYYRSFTTATPYTPTSG